MSKLESPATGQALPKSLEGHSVPEERLAQIQPLVAELAKTALAISQELPFQADAADFIAVLEAEGAKS